MKKIETTQTVILICDFCWKTEVDTWVTRFSFEKLELQGLRLYEKVDKTSYETKHLVWRKEVNFCCKECVKKWLEWQTDSFIDELLPPRAKETKREIITL